MAFIDDIQFMSVQVRALDEVVFYYHHVFKVWKTYEYALKAANQPLLDMFDEN
jgi:hypothetical protein